MKRYYLCYKSTQDNSGNRIVVKWIEFKNPDTLHAVTTDVTALARIIDTPACFTELEIDMPIEKYAKLAKHEIGKHMYTGRWDRSGFRYPGLRTKGKPPLHISFERHDA